MNLFELFVKIGVDDQASGKLKDIGGKLGDGLKTAAKVGVAAVGAASAAIVGLTKSAVDGFAEYEQLVGGAQLMFGNAYETVAKNAQDAYKTVQMSQNEYLQQVNGFATGLKTALGGNEQAAAELAHNIVKAEADIIAATGNTAENVQNAFNGIMKSNFTMLDNLQIGITPTKEGFQEVIDKVNEWNKANGEATNYQMGNLADMQSSLVDYIDMVGMSGYAQREASETITGSISSMKSAWSNLLTGLADDSADLETLVNNLVDSITGYTDESGNRVKGVVDNVFPVIKASLNGIGKLIKEVFPVAMQYIPQIITEFLPTIADAAVGIVTSIGTAIFDNIDQILEFGQQMLDSLLEGITSNVGNISGPVSEIITKFGSFILENLPEIIMAGINILIALVQGIVESIPELATAATKAIIELAAYLISAENLDKIISLGADLINALSEGIENVVEELVSVGEDIIESIKSGISSAWNGLVSWFNNLWDSLFGNRTVNVNVNTSTNGSHAGGLAYVPFDGYIAELHKGERVLTAGEASAYNRGENANNTSGVTIIQNIQAVPQTPVELAAATSAYFEQARWAF